MTNHPNRNKEASRLRLVIRDLVGHLKVAKAHLSTDHNRRLIQSCDQSIAKACEAIGDHE